MLRSEARGDAARIDAVLAGVRRYQAAPRKVARRKVRALARVGRAALLDFGGSGRPIVFVPSLINGSEILDLDRNRSLMRWLASAGFRPLLLDWGVPSSREASRDLIGHVTDFLNPLLDQLDQYPVLVGYCLGGTLALAAAIARPVHALGLIATPWDFAGFPDRSTEALARLWGNVQPSAESVGLMPMEALQLLFWSLDPERTLGKFADFGRKKDARSAKAFVPVEDWANAGPPMPYAAARELLEGLFGSNVTGQGRWSIAGRPVDPARLGIPTLEIVSTTDRIVPAACSAGLQPRVSLGLGHIGMIIGGEAKTMVWEPLAAWLRAVG